VIVTDASFWVSALLAQDTHHREADALLRRMAAEEITVIAPALAIIEVAGALVRRTQNPAAAEMVIRHLQGQPWLTLVPMTVAFAEIAARTAITCALRGADAIYVALARQEGLPLITRDNEILQRGAAAALIMTPADWLRQNPAAQA
jgi:predicted nucleic acid-binding protein